MKVPVPPAVWFPVGTAMHSACDLIDVEGFSAHDAYEQFVFDLDVGLSALEAEHGVPRSQFRTTGVTKALPSGKDEGWWRDNALNMLQQYVSWRVVSGYEVAVLGGRPAVELEIDLDLGNGTRLRGFVDRVEKRPDGALEVMDLKTGASQPGIYQLATYAYALGVQYGVAVNWGSYFMLAKDGHSTPKALQFYQQGTAPQEVYRRLDAAIKSGTFVPNIGADCFRCDFKQVCRFQ